MSRQAPSAIRVRITIGTKSIEATLADSEAARDFASLLPITLPAREVCAPAARHLGTRETNA